MAELTRIEQDIVKAMVGLGATREAGAKTVAEITGRANRPKGLVANTLSSLVRKKAAQRAVKGKTAGYYALKV